MITINKISHIICVHFRGCCSSAADFTISSFFLIPLLTPLLIPLYIFFYFLYILFFPGHPGHPGLISQVCSDDIQNFFAWADSSSLPQVLPEDPKINFILCHRSDPKLPLPRFPSSQLRWGVRRVL